MRKQSTATARTPIPLRGPIDPGRWPSLLSGLALTALAAVRHVWHETSDAHERLLARPWEREGPLRWQRDAGGRRLVGSALHLHESEGDRLRPPG